MMKNNQSNTLDVTIMGREYSVACNKDEQEKLLEAVDYLDKKMRNINAASKNQGTSNTAIMAALNITHELLLTRAAENVKKEFDIDICRRKIGQIEAMIDEALSQQERLF